MIPHQPAPTGNAPSETFHAHALDRIRNFMLILAPVFTLAALLKFGRWAALGFLLGCLISYLNFHWLKSAVLPQKRVAHAALVITTLSITSARFRAISSFCSSLSSRLDCFVQ